MAPASAPPVDYEIAALEQMLEICERTSQQARNDALPIWTPQPGPQSIVFSLDCDEIGYGGAAGGSKMLPLDTQVPIPSGWTTIGEIRPGDRIFTERGDLTTVLAVHPIDPKPKSYEMTFDDGTKIKACAGHLWLTFDAQELSALTRRDPDWRAARRERRPSKAKGLKSAAFTAAVTARNKRLATPAKPAPTGTVRTTEEIFRTLFTKSGRRNHAIPVAQPLQLPDAELPLAPYLLGLWLGDGDTRGGRFTTADPELVQAFGRAGFAVSSTHQKKNANCVTYYLRGLRQALRDVGVLGAKHIPTLYLRASEAQRQALLQGLMDTDGSTVRSTGAVTFSTTCRRLADDVQELIASLGNKARRCERRARLKGRDVGPVWMFKWTPTEPAFRLSRKLEIQRPPRGRKTRFRYIEACVPCDPVPMRCITVDNPTGLFLVERQMLPTHNTATGCALPMSAIVPARTNEGRRATDVFNLRASSSVAPEARPRITVRGYRALILRRKTPDLSKIIDEVTEIYHDGRAHGRFAFKPVAPGELSRFREDKGFFLFPKWGSRVELGHCHEETDYERYMGREYDDVIIDEGSQFTERQITRIASRRRGTIKGIRRRLLVTFNPPEPHEPGEKWIRRRYGPWLDRKFELPNWERVDDHGHTVRGKGLPPSRGKLGPAASAQILFVAKDSQGKEWFSTEPFEWNGARAMSRTFVMSRIEDNPAMLDAEPDYRSKVRDNDPVRAAQLEGDWEITYKKGLLFRRERFELVDEVPEGFCTWVRAWDFAGTEPNDENTDPDWTIGLKLGKHEDGFFYIGHVHRQRAEPGEVEAKRAHFVDEDGPGVKQLYPRDPAEAGKTVAGLRVSAAVDAGVDADVVPATKNVLSKSGPVSAAAHPRALGRDSGYGKIRVVRGEWNGPFFDVLEDFPTGRHDDDISALSDAYNYLMSAPGWVPPVRPAPRPAMRLGRSRGFG